MDNPGRETETTTTERPRILRWLLPALYGYSCLILSMTTCLSLAAFWPDVLQPLVAATYSPTSVIPFFSALFLHTLSALWLIYVASLLATANKRFVGHLYWWKTSNRILTASGLIVFLVFAILFLKGEKTTIDDLSDLQLTTILIISGWLSGSMVPVVAHIAIGWTLIARISAPDITAWIENADWGGEAHD